MRIFVFLSFLRGPNLVPRLLPKLDHEGKSSLTERKKGSGYENENVGWASFSVPLATRSGKFTRPRRKKTRFQLEMSVQSFLCTV